MSFIGGNEAAQVAATSAADYVDDMDRGDVGDVLVQLTRIEEDIKSIATEVDAVKEARKSYDKKLDDIASSVKRGLDEIKNRTNEIVALVASRGGGCTTVPRGYRAPRGSRTSLPKLEYAIGPDRMRKAFMGAACQVTVLKFLHSFPMLRFWSSERLWTSMMPLQGILLQATGLTVLFFAPVNNNKALFKTGPGKLWSYVTRRVIRTVLCDAKTVVFSPSVSSAPGSDSAAAPSTSAVTAAEGVGGLIPGTSEIQKPSWLDVLGDKDDIRRAVKAAADELELKKYEKRSLPLSTASSTSSIGSDPTAPSPAKRAKTTPRSGPDALTFQVVDETRYILVQYMNEARSNMREILFEKLFFLTDRIANERWTPAAAKSRGFWISFAPFSAEENLILGQQVPGDSPWRQFCVNARMSQVQGTGDINMARFYAMKKAFPCMEISLHYKRHIERPAASGEAESIDWVDKLNLHEIRIDILMECFKNGDKKTALGLSELSLKTVHIFALALRGLLLEKLGENPSDVERFARGVHVGCSKDAEISLVIDRETSKGLPTKKYTDTMRQKFRMAVQEYEKWKRAEEDRRTRSAAMDDDTEAVAVLDDIDDDELLQCG